VSRKTQNLRKYHIVYQTTNTINGKIYIGCHSTDVIEDGYIGSGLLLKRAVAMHGVSNFIRTVLFVFNNTTDMFAKEKELVNEEFVNRSDVYNIMLGGNGGLNRGIIGQKRLFHPETKKRIVAHQSAVDKLLSKGYLLKSGWSSSAGRVYVHKDGIVKSVLPESLEEMLNNGWTKGFVSSPTSNKVWIYHAVQDRYSLCDLADIKEMLGKGWIKKKWSPIEKGTTCWINDGTKNKRVNKEDLAQYPGWQRGAIQNQPRTKSRVVQ
jgi:hypothetical protein